LSPTVPGASATRTLAWLYCPPAGQPLLMALYGLEEEIGASLRPGIDHEVAHRRLAWWREECARAARGAAAHPLTAAAAACFAGNDPAPLEGLTGLVDAAVWDLARATFETRRELTAYCERWADALLVPLVAHAAPQLDSGGARALGAALREAELLRFLARDAHAGRIRLPLDELGAAGVEPRDLAQPPWNHALTALLHARHRELRGRLAASLRSLPHALQPALRGALVWASLAHATSRRAERRLPEGLAGGDDHGLLDGWRAWRAARRADAGHLILGP
jgi:15-cis-phytoene synthase